MVTTPFGQTLKSFHPHGPQNKKSREMLAALFSSSRFFSSSSYLRRSSIPSFHRSSIRSMADSAFKKIQIQRDDTVSFSSSSLPEFVFWSDRILYVICCSDIWCVCGRKRRRTWDRRDSRMVGCWLWDQEPRHQNLETRHWLQSSHTRVSSYVLQYPVKLDCTLVKFHFA